MDCVNCRWFEVQSGYCKCFKSVSNGYMVYYTLPNLEECHFKPFKSHQKRSRRRLIENAKTEINREAAGAT